MFRPFDDVLARQWRCLREEINFTCRRCVNRAIIGKGHGTQSTNNSRRKRGDKAAGEDKERKMTLETERIICRVQSELLLNNLKSFLHSLQGGHNWIRSVLRGGAGEKGKRGSGCQQRALAGIKTSVKAETDAVPERWQAKDFYKNLIWPKRSRTKEL